jgi:hypothetical protein
MSHFTVSDFEVHRARIKFFTKQVSLLAKRKVLVKQTYANNMRSLTLLALTWFSFPHEQFAAGHNASHENLWYVAIMLPDGFWKLRRSTQSRR